MPELPHASRTPQPTPRIVATVKRGPSRSRSGAARNQDPPVRADGAHQPTTIFVGGASRPVVNGVAFALAELIDLTPFWLDVRDANHTAEGSDPGNTGWIPPDRLFVSEGGEGLQASTLASSPALWTIVRSDEPASVLTHLTNFLRLPELIQEILSAAAANGGPKAVVVANSDRFAHLFPRTAEGLQRFLGTLTASELSIVAGHTGRVGGARFGFDVVFSLDSHSPEKWMESTITCEKGIARGPFAVGRANRLSDVPGIARVFTGLYPVKG